MSRAQKRLAGRVVWVVGASAGIGAATPISRSSSERPDSPSMRSLYMRPKVRSFSGRKA